MTLHWTADLSTMASDPIEALTSDLTDAQREAVEATEGPLLILAAAGSGKTRVITRRIAYLVGIGVPGWQILALTFTNKAAGEMRERVTALLERSGGGERALRGLTVTTFHSLCARLLRRYAPMMEDAPGWGVGPDYTIYDADDQRALMKRTIAELDLSTSNWPVRSVLGQISNAKNEMIDAKAFAAQAGDFHARTIARLYEAYQRGLREANAVDFDDLLLLTVRLLRECDEARAEVRQRWRYLMIDEYQDTNKAQFVLGTLVVGAEEGRAPNVCVVGDPDQSIYGWRGADISNILDFEEQYPGARVIALGQNFRSTAPILAAADHLIRHNQRRKHKDLFTTAEGGERPTVVICRDERHEAALVVDWFRHLASGGGQGEAVEAEPLAWKDMAVFYRNNALSRVMEEALRGAGVPYVIARGTAFYQREEVRDLLAYLRVIANPADEVSLARIVNKPARKLGKSSHVAIEDFARAHEITMMEAIRRVGEVPGVSSVGLRAAERFAQMIDAWSGSGTFMGGEVSGSLAELVGRVLAESGLEKHYQGVMAKAGGDASEDRVANLQELVSSAADFEHEYDPGADPALAPGEDAAPPLLALLRAFLESVSLVADADQVDPAKGAVTLMTLHAAKGLEFPAVAMIGLEEGLLPSMRAMQGESDLEEERRLAFVGITRAMRRLMITSARVRTHRGLAERTVPSRFLGELPDDGVVVSDQGDPLGGLEDELGPRRPRGARARGERPGGAWDDFDFDQSAGAGDEAGGLRPGARVRHPQFGEGEVLDVSGLGRNRRAKIAFRHVGTKTLVLEHARLTLV
jgi:DNA helicase-2/ATP-dependent DNA helicase PcrA